MDFDAVVIGSGVVGLGICKSIAEITSNIALVEKNVSFGMETSSRNSEVIHSGIYYPFESLKSKLCIEGNQLLYDYCESNKISFEKCGKLIIAKNDFEFSKLLDLKKKADKLKIKYSILDKKGIQKIEPLIEAESAIYIKETGVVDSHNLMHQLYYDLINLGVNIVFKTEVVDITAITNGYSIKIQNPDLTFSNFTTRIIVNSSGLYANNISSMVGINETNTKLQFWKGSYFWIDNHKAGTIKTLIYPIPNDHLTGLGIHLTKDINGRIKIGPDAEYVGENQNFNYLVDNDKRESFYNSCKSYLPFLNIDDIHPDYSGIRPKLQKPNEKTKDFIIRNEMHKGFNNFINLFGIESPGLTSCLAIGKYVKNIINWDF